MDLVALVRIVTILFRTYVPSCVRIALNIRPLAKLVTERSHNFLYVKRTARAVAAVSAETGLCTGRFGNNLPFGPFVDTGDENVLPFIVIVFALKIFLFIALFKNFESYVIFCSLRELNVCCDKLPLNRSAIVIDNAWNTGSECIGSNVLNSAGYIKLAEIRALCKRTACYNRGVERNLKIRVGSLCCDEVLLIYDKHAPIVIGIVKKHTASCERGSRDILDSRAFKGNVLYACITVCNICTYGSNVSCNSNSSNGILSGIPWSVLCLCKVAHYLRSANSKRSVDKRPSDTVIAKLHPVPAVLADSCAGFAVNSRFSTAELNGCKGCSLFCAVYNARGRIGAAIINSMKVSASVKR